jgi:hypothetical protein
MVPRNASVRLVYGLNAPKEPDRGSARRTFQHYPLGLQFSFGTVAARRGDDWCENAGPPRLASRPAAFPSRDGARRHGHFHSRLSWAAEGLPV